MNQIKLNDVKEKVFNILEYFAEFCDRNNLKYFLFYGTLLGAKRHEGFIPWDDDIDVVMPRKDYIALNKLWVDSNYILMSNYRKPDYYSNLAKIIDPSTRLIIDDQIKYPHDLGLYIDIFCLDGLPEDSRKQKHHFNRIYKLQVKWHRSLRIISVSKSNPIKSIIKKVYFTRYKIIGYKRYIRKIEKLSQKYSFSNVKNVTVLSYTTGDFRVYPKSIFEGKMRMKFNEKYFSVPDRTDFCLLMWYGDYKTLPPKSSQVTNHFFIPYEK